MLDCDIPVSGISAEVASIDAAYRHPCRVVRMALDILMKWPSLGSTENNKLYDCFKALRKRIKILTTGMALKK